MAKVEHQAAWAEKQGAYKPSAYKERERQQCVADRQRGPPARSFGPRSPRADASPVRRIESDVNVAANVLKETRRAGLQHLYDAEFAQYVCRPRYGRGPLLTVRTRLVSRWQEELGEQGLAVEKPRD